MTATKQVIKIDKNDPSFLRKYNIRLRVQLKDKCQEIKVLTRQINFLIAENNRLKDNNNELNDLLGKPY